MTVDERFARLKRPRAIWLVPAIHGAAEPLGQLHDAIGQRFRPGERLIYLGNMVGLGAGTIQVLDEVLAFRRALLSMPGMMPDDFVYLRGAQEEMWQKLHQLQFAASPREVLEWMASHGVGETVAAYGGNLREAHLAVREGVIAIGKWTRDLREAVRRYPGHEKLMTQLRRAAYTDPWPTDDNASGDNAGGGALLFVHAGLDPERGLAEQGDRFWWPTTQFDHLSAPYEGFNRVVRGFDPEARGLVETSVTLSLDAGAGRGGPLISARLGPDGSVLDVLEASSR